MARKIVALTLVVLVTTAVACGGSSKASPTATTTPSAFATEQTRIVEEVVKSVLASVPVSTSITALTFVDPQNGWAVNKCSDLNGTPICDILATSDGGVTWRVQHRDVDRLGSLQFLDAQNGFAIGGDAGVLVTHDGGATWTRRGGPAPAVGGIRFVTPKIGFATASGVVFRSSDEGNTWVFNYGSAECSFSSVSFSSADEGWAGGRGPDGPCLFRTANGGKTWKASFLGVQSSSLKSALSQTTRYGEPVAPLLQINTDCSSSAPEFHNSGEARLRISCQMGEGITLTTTDDGKSWRFDSQQYACLMSCMTRNYQTGGGGPTFYLDLDHAWQRTAHQEISWSSDGGKTWDKVNGSELCCDAENIFFVDANHGWISFGESIAVTTNGGRTWNRLPVTIQ